MTLGLHNLKRGKRKFHKRAGRGNSGHKGNYSGKGSKGQKARSGGKHKGGFSGKKVPNFILKLPKIRGFKSSQEKYEIVNIGDLEKSFDAGSVISISLLVKKSIIQKGKKVKILGNGRLTKKFTVEAHAFSRSAEHAIKSAGGEMKTVAKN